MNNDLLDVFGFPRRYNRHHVGFVAKGLRLVIGSSGFPVVTFGFICGATRGKAAPAEQHGTENLVTHR